MKLISYIVYLSIIFTAANGNETSSSRSLRLTDEDKVEPAPVLSVELETGKYANDTRKLQADILTKIEYCFEGDGPGAGRCSTHTRGETIYNFLTYWNYHSYARSYPGQDWWAFLMPARCPSGYVEAASHIGPNGGKCGVGATGSGSSRRCGCNDVLSCSLKHLGIAIPDACNADKPYLYQKVRVCVKQGAACLPGSQLQIKGDKYYNIILKDIPSRMMSGRQFAGGEHTVTTPGKNWYWQASHPGQHVFWNSNGAKSYNQWRFEKTSNRKYFLVNRQTGRYLTSEYYDFLQQRDWIGKLDVRSKATPIEVSPTCDGNGAVKLHAWVSGNRWGFKTGMLDGPAMTASSWTERMETGCCSSGCPSGWTQTHSKSDGCFIFCKYQVCSRRRTKAEVFKLDRDFYIREVAEYESPTFRNEVSNLAMNPVNDLAVTLAGAAVTLGQSIATSQGNRIKYGNWAINKQGQVVNKILQKFPKHGTKILKAATMGLSVVGFGLTLALDLLEESVDEKLAKLEQRITEQMKELVADAVLKNNIQYAQRMMKTNREVVLRDTMLAKYNLFKLDRSNPVREAKFVEDLDDIADELKAKADHHYGYLQSIVPNGIEHVAVIPESSQNIKLAHYGFNTYLLGAMEYVSMAQESVFASAYLSSAQNCDILMENVNFGHYVLQFKNNAKKLQTLLVNSRLKKVVVKSLISSSCPRYCGWKAYDTFYGENQAIAHTGSDSARYFVDEAANTLKAELKWDIENVSYRLTEFSNVMNSIVSKTRQQCAQLLPTTNNAASRNEYKQAVLQVKPSWTGNPMLCATNDC